MSRIVLLTKTSCPIGRASNSKNWRPSNHLEMAESTSVSASTPSSFPRTWWLPYTSDSEKPESRSSHLMLARMHCKICIKHDACTWRGQPMRKLLMVFPLSSRRRSYTQTAQRIRPARSRPRPLPLPRLRRRPIQTPQRRRRLHIQHPGNGIANGHGLAKSPRPSHQSVSGNRLPQLQHLQHPRAGANSAPHDPPTDKPAPDTGQPVPAESTREHRRSLQSRDHRGRARGGHGGYPWLDRPQAHLRIWSSSTPRARPA